MPSPAYASCELLRQSRFKEFAMSRNLRSLLAVVLSLAVLSAAIAWQSGGSNKQPEVEKIATTNAGPSYWKGNLHTHSFWSDGDDFPEMIADWYKRHGYNFLTLSDHNTLSDGERWIDVPEGKGTRDVAVKKYIARFGNAWVELRKKAKDDPGIAEPCNVFLDGNVAR